ncbi:MAG: alpha/beta hydrolase [Myxococcales bacterium]|nr:MAG: alpha/beta hydrolase [Myxococcales bacterium]
MLAHRISDQPSIPGLTPEGPEYFSFASADGTRLEGWRNRADGPIVLLCNGLGTNPWCWPALMDPDCGVHVISWNHRGTGNSERPGPGKKFGIDAFVEDAVALMDHLGLEQAPVMGWSMGVNTAFELAYLHPERVSALFAVGGVPGGTFSSMMAPLGIPRPLRAAITVNIARALSVVGGLASKVVTAVPIGPRGVHVLTHSGFMLPTPDPANTQRVIREFLTTPLDWYMRMAVETSKHVRVSLRDIKVPASFVSGTYDVLASAADMRTAAERIEGATYDELKASHFLSMEHPDEVHRLLRELLDRVE